MGRGESLRVVVGRHGCTEALAGDEIAGRPAVVTLEDEPALIGSFRRMVREEAFDVCELALTTYVCAKGLGMACTALPVFPVRAFHHGAVVGLADAVARGPEALVGTRVGVNRGYTVTTGVWARGILGDEHGLDPDAVTWVRSGDEHVATYVPPANVEDLAPGDDLGTALAEGRVQAVVGGRVEVAGAQPFVADPLAAGLRALEGRGHYPINHCVVVRDAVLAEDPALATALFEAFAAAKAAYLDRLGRDDPALARSVEAQRHRDVMAVTGDPLPYGLAANGGALEELLRHALRQRILASASAPESLFAEATRGLAG